MLKPLFRFSLVCLLMALFSGAGQLTMTVT